MHVSSAPPRAFLGFAGEELRQGRGPRGPMPGAPFVASLVVWPGAPSSFLLHIVTWGVQKRSRNITVTGIFGFNMFNCLLPR